MSWTRAWGVSVAVAVGGAAQAADPKPIAPARAAVVIAPLPADVLAEAVRAEMDAYLRRLDVCNKLREVAFQKGDEKLALQADDLERAATGVYQGRTRKLGVKPAGPADKVLDAKLGTGAAVTPLTVAPPTPDPAVAKREGGKP